MEDRKLKMLYVYYQLSINQSNVYMWFSIPGGLMTGKAITFEEYLKILLQSENMPKEEKQEHDEQPRFFCLKDVSLIHAEKHHKFNVARLDALEVAAWGFFDPTTSYSI